MQLGRINRSSLAMLVLLLISSNMLWAEDIPPPELKPYTLPTFHGTEPAINDHVDPLIKGPTINADTIFQKVLACYPHKSKWKIDVELRGSMASDNVISDSGNALGKNYVQIVASMPLYSAKEMDRAIRNEHDLRTETAKTVAQFVKAIAERNNGLRKLALYESLEARSAVRVKSGVVAATEQVGYLEKVVNAHEAVTQAEAEIMTARIALSAMCAGDNYEAMNRYLSRLAEVPD